MVIVYMTYIMTKKNVSRKAHLPKKSSQPKYLPLFVALNLLGGTNHKAKSANCFMYGHITDIAVKKKAPTNSFLSQRFQITPITVIS
mmetsp:Transcript_64606/g.75798  ORF Transcript_64606/g.75798 Transcript_64606/m.75798 type:complete len:87 (-) Transcript_64606:562-822(-)